MITYAALIQYTYGHYEVYTPDGAFCESCDTYEEAQQVVDEMHFEQ